jgi:hypothetical protein
MKPGRRKECQGRIERIKGGPGKLVDYHLPVCGCQGIAFGPPSHPQVAYSDRRERPLCVASRRRNRLCNQGAVAEIL